MATMSLPSKAFGAPAKRRQQNIGLMAAIAKYFSERRARQEEAAIAQYVSGRWSDATEREVSDALMFGNRRSFR